jgi:hypothetical protein
MQYNIIIYTVPIIIDYKKLLTLRSSGGARIFEEG